MACPVHIWVPLMAAAAPFAANARDRVRAALDRGRARRALAPPAPREVHRWAPVGPHAAEPESRPE